MIQKRQRITWSIIVFPTLLWISLTNIPTLAGAYPSKLPEVSSTLLKTHRLYMQQPPHDTLLYDVLHVSANATSAEITRQYRKVSRPLHPDKRRKNDHNDDNDNDDDDSSAAEQLQRVREAYEVLKDDASRLPYHRYGLQDVDQAAWILTGIGGNLDLLDPDACELLRLMGYDSDSMKSLSSSRRPSDAQAHDQRLWFLAASILEKIRPLVEGVVTEAILADAVIRECDRLKRLPLGAQILRCIGRAYRYSGKQKLRKYKAKGSPISGMGVSVDDLSHNLREKLRHAKHIWNAAVASGRVVMSEQLQIKRQRQRQQQQQQQSKEETIMSSTTGYHWDGELGELTSEGTSADADVPTDEELKELERSKARKALLESLQVEALWKIRKIELDRTVRKACDLILDGNYFFYPSHQSSRPANWQDGGDGWVGSSGVAIDARDGHLRAASALVLIGNIMVQRSKEGTSWME
jgi:curved DNA-binding protein CbpA